MSTYELLSSPLLKIKVGDSVTVLNSRYPYPPFRDFTVTCVNKNFPEVKLENKTTHEVYEGGSRSYLDTYTFFIAGEYDVNIERRSWDRNRNWAMKTDLVKIIVE